jgi:hydroxyacylglutathione hydrolase
VNMPPWFHFFQRPFPSANMVLIQGARPLLIDSGYGSDIRATEDLVRSAGTPPEAIALLANTHYHCDHAGGNAALQERFRLAIAAHAWDAALINRRDPEACSAVWLDQPVEPYTVSLPLSDGDRIETGTTTVQVIHTPGHTLGHVSYYLPVEQIVICGDAVHGDDAAWLNYFREGVGALDRAIASLDRLAALPARWACSGHGAAFTDVAGAIARARARYVKWQAQPELLAWHACKRIGTYALMIYDGLAAANIAPYFTGCGWFQDYARAYFHLAPADFVAPLVAELVRANAARWEGGRLVSVMPCVPPAPGWLRRPGQPAAWPAPDPLCL